jgi:AGZA family xanthine/uracil permease-like MFS transporter
MAYIIVVNPAILETAGIPKGASTTATILSAAFGTAVMALYANRPFAIAPYMGENAFIAFTVVKSMGYSWQAALGAVFVAGVLFTVLTVFKIRGWLAEAIPMNLKLSFAVGIGLFLTFIGLNATGIIRLGVPGAPVALGDMTQPAPLLAVFCFFAIVLLSVRKVPGAILLGMLVTTFLSFLFKAAPVPERWVGLPPDLSPVFMALDLRTALTPGFFSIVLTVFVMAFVDTVGTLIGLSARAGLLDEKGNLPDIEKPMLADALATTAAPLLGTTTTGAYIESAAGIEEGGRTGFTSLVVAALFLLSMFLAPLFTAVPPQAYGAVLVVIGSYMIAPVARIDFKDPTELIPCFLTITLISFSYNVGVGMTAGIISYPLLKTLCGRWREVPRGLWILALLSLSFYVCYPYG